MDPRSICRTDHRTTVPGGMKYRRLLAGTMAFVVLVTVMFSLAYIAIESGHDCCGEECHICESIRECEKIASRFCAGAAKNTSPAAVTFIAFLIVSLICLETVFTRESPVSSKIQLNI